MPALPYAEQLQAVRREIAMRELEQELIPPTPRSVVIERARDKIAALESRLREVEGELDAVRKDAARLRKALKYYAHAKHLVAPDFWDSCSGEHSMWKFPDHDHMDETMVEGGWIAAQALDGKDAPYLTDDGDLIDDENAAVDAAIIGSGT